MAKVYRDHGISGAKGRNGRPAFDALCRDATKRQFDIVMAWNVDRLGRSLKDLVAFLSASTYFCISRVSIRPRRPARPCFRCWASLPSSSTRLSKSAFALAYSGPSVKVSALVGRPIRAALAGGMSVRKTAAKFAVNPSTVQRVAHPFEGADNPSVAGAA